jgi:hypothetical protein
MIHFIKTYIWVLLPFLFINGSQLTGNVCKEIYHVILVEHPGEKTKVSVTLVEIQNEAGLPIKYYTDVESVICLEQVCKVIPVRLFWNNLGEFQTYTLKEGEVLEKYEADLFDKSDYTKLHTILANKESPFKGVFIDEVITVPNELEDHQEEDAISGATALELDEKDTVKGAALTCYTLWHWANGDLVSKVKEITAKSASVNQLHVFLADEKKDYFHLSINELKFRENYEESILKAVINRVLVDESLLKKGFSYFNLAPDSSYFCANKEVFFRGEKNQKLAAIKSLQQSESNISESYLDAFSYEFKNLTSYQEVSALLELMQSRNPNSSKVIDNVFPLLNADFLIARSAYWFLRDKKVSAEVVQKLTDFFSKNKERL